MTPWMQRNAAWLERAHVNWVPEKKEALQIRAWFRSPIAWDSYFTLQLEGALQFVVVGLETGRSPDDVYAGIGAHEWHPPTIPIAVSELESDTGIWPVHHASAGFPAESVIEDVRYRRKRARVEDYALNRAQTAGGAYKSLNIPVPTVICPFLDFWVVGDRLKLQRLLPEIPGFGRDIPRGLGTIAGFDVISASEDRSFHWKHGPSRPLPSLSDGGERDVRTNDPAWCELKECATHAPYWHSHSKTLSLVPTISLGAVYA